MKQVNRHGSTAYRVETRTMVAVAISVTILGIGIGVTGFGYGKTPASHASGSRRQPSQAHAPCGGVSGGPL